MQTWPEIFSVEQKVNLKSHLIFQLKEEKSNDNVHDKKDLL